MSRLRFFTVLILCALAKIEATETLEVIRVEGLPAQTFQGVLAKPGGIVVWGNAFGCPKGASAKLDLLGQDPAQIPGDGNPEGTPAFLADHPARTGFVLSCDATGQVKSGMRFATGLATIDAAAVAPDGTLFTAGLARNGFRALTSNLKTVPAKNDPRYGSVSSLGITMPGDVYLAKWNVDLKSLAWVVIFEGHRKAPDHLVLTSDGKIFLAVRSVFSVTQDGKNVQECGIQETNTESQASFFADISADGKSILMAGWLGYQDRARPWVGPLVELRSPEGKLQRRFYDWTPALVGNPAINLLNPAPISHAASLSTGALAVAAMSQDDNTVLGASPVDPSRPLNRSGKQTSESRGTVERVHLAVFDPQTPLKGAWIQLAHSEGRLLLNGLRALSGGRLMVFGEQGKTASGGKGALPIYAGKPDGFVAIYNADLSATLPVKMLPNLKITDIQEVGGNLFITGGILGEKSPATVLLRLAMK